MGHSRCLLLLRVQRRSDEIPVQIPVFPILPIPAPQCFVGWVPQLPDRLIGLIPGCDVCFYRPHPLFIWIHPCPFPVQLFVRRALCLLRMCDETLSGDLTALSARVERLEDGARRGKILRSAVPAQTGQASSPAPEAAPAPAPAAAEDAPPGRSRLCRRNPGSGCSTRRRPRPGQRPRRRRLPRRLPGVRVRQRPAVTGGGRWRRAAKAVCRPCTGYFWISAPACWRETC